MDNQNSTKSEDRWMDDRLASLTPPSNWEPHVDRALERVLQRQASRGESRWIRLSMAGAALAATGVIVVMLPWSTLWTPKANEPANKMLPVPAQQESVPEFAADTSPVFVTNARDEAVQGSRVDTRTQRPLRAPQAIITEAIPPLPDSATEAEFFHEGVGRKKSWQTGGPIAAQAKGGGQQESSPTSVTEPALISSVQPVYTEEAKQAKVTGIVELVCTVHTDGSATVERVAKGLGYGLDESAQEAVMQWRFAPGKKDGVAVNTVVTIVVRFGLK